MGRTEISKKIGSVGEEEPPDYLGGCCFSASAMEDDKGVTLEELKMKLADFAKERDWDQFHSPRNLLLALVGEVGELSELFQWKGEVPRGLPGWSEDEKTHLGEELSDVLLYLVRLSDICNVDLGKATLRKLELNAIKYPVHLAKGSSRKLGEVNTSATTSTNGLLKNGSTDDGKTGNSS
ncbi:hypothetical protein Droror1_Dr00009704 [Drosera rotundifolia]